MPGRPQRRRQVIVEGFHGRFVVVQLAWIAALMLLLAMLLFTPLIGSLLRDDGVVEAEVANRFLLLHETLWPLLFGLFAAAAAVTIKMSHRVAGPLYRFRLAFAQIAAGDLTATVTTRQHDYLRDEATALQQMVVELRNRVQRAKAAVRSANVPAAEAALAEFRTEPAPMAPPDPVEQPRPDLSVRDPKGFSLVELLLVVAIMAVVIALAAPQYLGALEAARVVKAVGDIRAISAEVKVHQVLSGCMPSSLAAMGRDTLLDPWGRPYVYYVFSDSPGDGGGGRGGGRGMQGGGGGGSCPACSGGCASRGAARKDRRLNPINSDFDLYSVGRDGESAGPLTAHKSQDDVIRGSDGGFIGLARNY